MDMKHPLVALAFHNILEQGAEGFSLARLYQDLTGAPLPEHRTENFASNFMDDAIRKAMADHFPDVPVEKSTGSAFTNIYNMLLQGTVYLGLTPARIAEIYNAGLPVTLADLPADFRLSLGNRDSLLLNFDKLREQVGTDLHRRFQGTSAITVDFGNGTRFETGPGGAALRPEYGAVHGQSLETNRFAQTIVAETDRLCGGHKAQQAAVYSLFTASGLSFFGRGAGNIVQRDGMPPTNEHANFSVQLQRQDSGAIVGLVTSAPGYPYEVRVEYTILPDGSNTMTDLYMAAREEAADV
jgi:hypothetical protein